MWNKLFIITSSTVPITLKIWSSWECYTFWNTHHPYHLVDNWTSSDALKTLLGSEAELVLFGYLQQMWPGRLRFFFAKWLHVTGCYSVNDAIWNVVNWSLKCSGFMHRSFTVVVHFEQAAGFSIKALLKQVYMLPAQHQTADYCSGWHKHDSTWMSQLLCVCWMCKHSTVG